MAVIVQMAYKARTVALGVLGCQGSQRHNKRAYSHPSAA